MPEKTPAKKAAAQKQAAPKAEPKRTLVRNVLVGGKSYGPAHPENVVTPEVEAQITNPRAWGE